MKELRNWDFIWVYIHSVIQPFSCLVLIIVSARIKNRLDKKKLNDKIIIKKNYKAHLEGCIADLGVY